MNDIEERLGFDRIKQLVADECTNRLAQHMALQLTFSADYDVVVRELALCEEMRQIVMFGSDFPSQDFIDLSDELRRLRLPGTVIEQEEMIALKLSLSTLGGCLRFLHRDEAEPYVQLRQLVADVEVDADLARKLDRLLTDSGELADNASPELMDIRRTLQRRQLELDRRVAQCLQRAKVQGWAAADAEATIRDGHPVIPLLDTHRRKMHGLIHDESATRRTAYVEPEEVVELSNDLKELLFAQRREEHRIRATFTEQLRPSLPTLSEAYRVLACIDLARAKARFALGMNAYVPIVVNQPQAAWLEARHPLLQLSLRQRANQNASKHKVDGSNDKVDGEADTDSVIQRVAQSCSTERRDKPTEVVPFDITLGSDQRIIIISGPNAGGKSVCLKAVGLLQYMLQCGLPVTCRPTSEFGIFSSVFIDIGDSQSIDDDLSTYTSHLQHMKQLLATADARSLFLLDELGGGTEPRLGCAIAEATLESLCHRGSYGVVTTHFADLKLLSDRLPEVVNGAMLYDTEHMCPLFRLSIGNPGSSFAFEIARSIGFPADVLAEASTKVGTTILNFEQQLQQLEADKEELRRQRTELQMKDDLLNEVIGKYNRLSEQLESRRHVLLSEARQQARTILSEANRTVENTIASIRMVQAEKERTLQARKQLQEAADCVAADQVKADNERQLALQRRAKTTPLATATLADDTMRGIPAPGDIVRIDGQDTFAQVIAVKGKKATVESRSVRMTIPLDQLTKTSKKALPPEPHKTKSTTFASVYDNLNDKRAAFNPTLDLRGYRGDDALAELRYFVDEAMLLGEKHLRILHGKGYGILKTLIRQWLHSCQDVQEFHSEQVELGGDGITVVVLR